MATSTPSNHIKPGEHVFVAGGTGSGKSVLSDIFTAGMDEKVIKIDIKEDTYSRMEEGEPVWSGLPDDQYEICTSLEAVVKSEKSKIIYIPPQEEQNLDYYDALCEYVFRNGHMRLWVDELMLFAPSPTKFPSFLKAILVAGRSRRASVWLCTQRPVNIPKFCVANCQHFFVFWMNQFSDRQFMVENTGAVCMMDRLPRYAWWYYREGSDPDYVDWWMLNI